MLRAQESWSKHFFGRLQPFLFYLTIEMDIKHIFYVVLLHPRFEFLLDVKLIFSSVKYKVENTNLLVKLVCVNM